jgi:hypothetical protein
MQRSRLAFLVLAGAAPAVIGLTVAAPAGADGNVGTIANFGDGKCLRPGEWLLGPGRGDRDLRLQRTVAQLWYVGFSDGRLASRRPIGTEKGTQ